MMSGSDKVTLVVGLGEVGKPLFTILQKREPEAIGIDITPVQIDGPVGIMHICFPFMDAAHFQRAVVEYARKYTPEVIVIHSTVIPGTTRGIEKECGIPCVYSPIRGKHTKMVDELCTYVKFVAGVDALAADKAQEHLCNAGLKTERMTAPETLELAKLLETTYFGVLIAWAQEMNRFAEKVNGDYIEIGKFFREISYLPSVLFQPGYIGGHCVMPNIALLQQCFQSDFLDTVQKSNAVRKVELAVEEEKATRERLQPLSIA